MHTPLAPHLHTEECNKIIAKLLECHRDNSKFMQFLGACNELDTQMRKCTKRERLERTAEHHKMAKERNERIQERMKEKSGKDWREGKLFKGSEDK